MVQNRCSNLSMDLLEKFKKAKLIQSSTSNFTHNDFCRRTKLKNPKFYKVIGNGQVTMRKLEKCKIGYKPSIGDRATISYVEKLEDGLIVENKRGKKIHIGDYEVPIGLDKAIPFMRVGERAEVKMRLKYAYKKIDLREKLGEYRPLTRNTMIIYVVKLFRAKPETIKDIQSYKLRKKYARKKRIQANIYFNRKMYRIAIKIYLRAIKYLTVSSAFIRYTYIEMQDLLKARLVLYNCMAIALTKIRFLKEAWESIEHVLRYEATNSKALFIKAWLMNEKGDLEACNTLLNLSQEYYKSEEEREDEGEEENEVEDDVVEIYRRYYK